MKLRFRMLAASLVAIPVFAFAAIAYAAGQIEGGDIYRVRNVTKNTAFTDPANADLCDTVQFRVRIHNPGPDPLHNVTVRATLPSGVATSHSSTVTVSASDANPPSTSDTAGVILSQAGSIAYVPGSTELLDTNGARISGLPDGIVGGGVSFSTVGVSIQQIRSVQFQAKINCPPPPPAPAFACVLLTLTKLDNRKVSVTASHTVSGGAVFDHYVYNFGDGTAPVSTTNSTVEHTYAADGNYTARVTVFVMVNGQMKEATSDACAKPVSFSTTPPPTTPPPTTTPPPVVPAGTAPTQPQPEALPNTGLAELMGVFVATSGLAAFAHRLVTARRS